MAPCLRLARQHTYKLYVSISWWWAIADIHGAARNFDYVTPSRFTVPLCTSIMLWLWWQILPMVIVNSPILSWIVGGLGCRSYLPLILISTSGWLCCHCWWGNHARTPNMDLNSIHILSPNADQRTPCTCQEQMRTEPAHLQSRRENMGQSRDAHFSYNQQINEGV